VDLAVAVIVIVIVIVINEVVVDVKHGDAN